MRRATQNSVGRLRLSFRTSRTFTFVVCALKKVMSKVFCALILKHIFHWYFLLSSLLIAPLFTHTWWMRTTLCAFPVFLLLYNEIICWNCYTNEYWDGNDARERTFFYDNWISFFFFLPDHPLECDTLTKWRKMTHLFMQHFAHRFVA